MNSFLSPSWLALLPCNSMHKIQVAQVHQSDKKHEYSILTNYQARHQETSQSCQNGYTSNTESDQLRDTLVHDHFSLKKKFM